jgi:hypothetical protein
VPAVEGVRQIGAGAVAERVADGEHRPLADDQLRSGDDLATGEESEPVVAGAIDVEPGPGALAGAVGAPAATVLAPALLAEADVVGNLRPPERTQHRGRVIADEAEAIGMLATRAARDVAAKRLAGAIAHLGRGRRPGNDDRPERQSRHQPPHRRAG